MGVCLCVCVFVCLCVPRDDGCVYRRRVLVGHVLPPGRHDRRHGDRLLPRRPLLGQLDGEHGLVPQDRDAAAAVRAVVMVVVVAAVACGGDGGGGGVRW